VHDCLAAGKDNSEDGCRPGKMVTGCDDDRAGESLLFEDAAENDSFVDRIPHAGGTHGVGAMRPKATRIDQCGRDVGRSLSSEERSRIGRPVGSPSKRDDNVGDNAFRERSLSMGNDIREAEPRQHGNEKEKTRPVDEPDQSGTLSNMVHHVGLRRALGTQQALGQQPSDLRTDNINLLFLHVRIQRESEPFPAGLLGLRQL